MLDKNVYWVPDVESAQQKPQHQEVIEESIPQLNNMRKLSTKFAGDHHVCETNKGIRAREASSFRIDVYYKKIGLGFLSPFVSHYSHELS